MSNWRIGQDIVCVKTHPKGVVKEGELYTIKALRTTTCKCSEVEIDVGVLAREGAHIYQLNCLKCGSICYVGNDRTYWLSETRFRPLDELADISELTEVLETKKPFEP